MILRRIGKAVDAVLIDQQPLAHAEFLANTVFQITRRFELAHGPDPFAVFIELYRFLLIRTRAASATGPKIAVFPRRALASTAACP